MTTKVVKRLQNLFSEVHLIAPINSGKHYTVSVPVSEAKLHYKLAYR